MPAAAFLEIKKYNPYHGGDGKFTGPGGSKRIVPFRSGQTTEILSDNVFPSGDSAIVHNDLDGDKGFTHRKEQERKKGIAARNGIIAKNPSDQKYYDEMMRKDPPPKKTRKAYKCFAVNDADGKLYPPKVANPGGMDTPVGVWLDALPGERAQDSKTGRWQVRAGGKGTDRSVGSGGSLSYRPGWHCGDYPEAKQFARSDPKNGVKEKVFFPKDFVWAEVEIDCDHDYQKEAMSYGYTANGKFRHSYAGLPRIPKGGSYRYRTNPNPDTAEWSISGSMKVTRILDDDETNALMKKNGLKPMKRLGGRFDIAGHGFRKAPDGSLVVDPAAVEANTAKKKRAGSKTVRKSWLEGRGKTMAKLFGDIRKLCGNSKDIEKFNPYHDQLGRFTTGTAATSFTYKPGASKAHNRAIAREVVRTGKLGNRRMVGTVVDENASGTNVYKPKRQGGRLIGNAVRQYNRTERQTNAGAAESARDRKNRLARERRARKKNEKYTGAGSISIGTERSNTSKVSAQNRKNNPVYRMLQGNRRPKKAKRDPFPYHLHIMPWDQ